MNRKEISKIILILKTSYPYAFKDMGEEEITNMVELYEEMFKENTYEEVSSAIKCIVNTNEYMPSIATIKNKIYELKHPQQESNTELWEKLLIALRNGIYGANEEFNKLPKAVQKFVGSPQQLTEIALMDSETVHSVIKGQFLKQIEYIKQSIKEQEMMSPQIKTLLEKKGILKIEEVIE